MNLSRQKLILIDGPMGAGKTTTASLLYKRLGYTAFLGLGHIKWFISKFPMTDKASRMVSKVILTMCKCYLDQGLPVVVEQSFREKGMMTPYLNLAKKKKIPVLIYELIAPKEILLNRIKNRPNLCPEKRKYPLWRIKRCLNSYPRQSFAPIRLNFDSSKLSPRQIVNRIVKDIKAA